MRQRWLALCGAIACLLAPAAVSAQDVFPSDGGHFGAVGNFSIVGSASGTPDKLTLKAKVQVATEDAGKQGEIYVIAALPGLVFSRKADGSWAYWAGGDLAVNSKGTLGTHDVNVIENADLYSLPDIVFYVGYGMSQADMLDNGKYSKLSIKNQNTNLDGTWQIVSTTGGFFKEPPQYLYIATDATVVVAVSSDPNGCNVAASIVVSGDAADVEVIYNNGSSQCSANDAPGTKLHFKFVLDGDTLTMTASDGSSATFSRLVIQ